MTASVHSVFDPGESKTFWPSQSPQTLNQMANHVGRNFRLRTIFNPSRTACYPQIKAATETLVSKMWRPTILGGAGLTAGKFFLTLNTSTIAASGSFIVIGTAAVFVGGAAAVGYGVGTAIDKAFNISDRAGDRLYSLIGDSLYQFFS